MARYIAKERGQIPAAEVQPTKRADSSPNRKVMRIVEKGEEFDYYGKPGKWMEPVKAHQPKADSGKPPGRPAGKTRSGPTDPDGSQAGQSPGAGGADLGSQ